jgi:hypothetical protein
MEGTDGKSRLMPGVLAGAAPSRYRLRSWKAKVVMVLGSLALTFGGLEWAARIYVSKKYGDSRHGMNWRFHYEPYVLTRTDERLRRAVPPKGAAFRIVLVGGSTAALVPDGMLAEEFGRLAGRPVEVINLGQGGFILNQERVALLLHGLAARPDVVITLDGANDLVTASKTGRPGITYSNDFIALAVERPLLNGLFGFVRDSQFINCANKLRERRIERAAHEDAALLDSTVAHITEALRSISTIAHGLEVPHVMIIQPYASLRANLRGDERAQAAAYAYRAPFMAEGFRRVIARLQAEAGTFPGAVHFIDATTAFDSTDAGCFIDEVHLTEDGNRLLCRHIADSLRRQGFAATATARR